MVSQGTSLRFDVQGTTGGLAPIDDTDLRSAVVGGLAPYFDVLNVAITRGSLLENMIDFQWYHWDYSAAVTIRLRGDYGALADVGSVIRSVFWSAAGAAPTVTSRDAGESQDPALTTTGPDLAGLGQGLVDFLKNTEWLIVGGLILIVALVMFSPTGRAAGRSLGNIRAL